MELIESYGIKEKDWVSILSIIKKSEKIEHVILYGSRAKGNFKYNSDIDLVLVGQEISFLELANIENELDDLLLPYKIDLSLYHTIDNPDLIAHIDRVGIELL